MTGVRSTTWILLATLAVLFSGALSYVHMTGHHAGHQVGHHAGHNHESVSSPAGIRAASGSHHAGCDHAHMDFGYESETSQIPVVPGDGQDQPSQDQPSQDQPGEHDDCRLCLLLLTTKASSFDFPATFHADRVFLELVSVDSCPLIDFDRPGVIPARGPPQLV